MHYIERIELPQKLYGIYNFNFAFFNCRRLEYINLTQLDLNEDIISIESMFQNCYALKSVSFPSIEAEHLNSTKKMFYGCRSLEYIDMGDFLTDELISLDDMFKGCESLKKINMSKFYSKKSTSMDNIFGNTSKNFTIVYNKDNNPNITKQLDLENIDYIIENDL